VVMHFIANPPIWNPSPGATICVLSALIERWL
jgi:hypothetical protein